jgi:hypothetical protein
MELIKGNSNITLQRSMSNFSSDQTAYQNRNSSTLLPDFAHIIPENIKELNVTGTLIF